MQAVPLAALNGSVMAAFKPPSLSPNSTELAHTMASNTVYEISATTTNTPPVNSPADMEDKCRLGEEAMSYATQYYSTVESGSRASSPSTLMVASPKDSAGNLTPVSVSSKETSSSDSMSALEDDGGAGDVLAQQGMCIPISSEEHGGEQGTTQVRHWTYEDQFKQVSTTSNFVAGEVVRMERWKDRV